MVPWILYLELDTMIIPKWHWGGIMVFVKRIWGTEKFDS